MRLDDALDQIADIRRRMAAATVFRGYRSTTALFSAAVAVGGAVAQAVWVPRPRQDLAGYLDLWCGAAVACCGVGLGAVVVHCRRSRAQWELARSAVGALLPSLVAGGLLTVVFWFVAPGALWLLPGLWAVLFGLGVLASRPLLPAGTDWVGRWYLLAGVAAICLSAPGRHPPVLPPLCPWLMAVPFGVGQTAAAAVLYFALERRGEPHGQR